MYLSEIAECTDPPVPPPTVLGAPDAALEAGPLLPVPWLPALSRIPGPGPTGPLPSVQSPVTYPRSRLHGWRRTLPAVLTEVSGSSRGPTAFSLELP
ncbi:hypothetical protein AAY473_029051 [Plecturocebus cupreus]